MIAAAVKKTYGVKVKAVNIINIPRKARRVGRTMGFKAGYKKAVITLAKGQSIEIAK
jgi:large subunit ribosomal protein L23